MSFLLIALVVYLLLGLLVVARGRMRDCLNLTPTSGDTVDLMFLFGALLLWLFWPLFPLVSYLFRLPVPPESKTTEANRTNLRVGCEGRTLTPLRPCGEVDIAGCKYAARAEHGFIQVDEFIRVVAHAGSTLVVRPCSGEYKNA